MPAAKTPPRPPRRYAEGTDVTVDRSRAELERLLDTHGATAFAVYRDESEMKVIFRLQGRMIRHVVRYPHTLPKRRGTPTKNALDAEFRRRWRALVLITRAKLELIAAGDSDVEREFLADTMLPNGATVYETAKERIAESYLTGGMPEFLLGPGGA